MYLITIWHVQFCCLATRCLNFLGSHPHLKNTSLLLNAPAGNRTPVLERRSRSSPGAVSDVAFLGPGARTDTSPTGPVRIESRSPLLTESDQQVS